MLVVLASYSLIYFLLAVHKDHDANGADDSTTESQLRRSRHVGQCG